MRHAPHRRHRLLLRVTLAVITLSVLIVSAVSVLHRSEDSAPPPPIVRSPSLKVAPPRAMGPIEASGDPEEFVRAVAETLFTWDTRTQGVPGDVAQKLLVVADPSGVETPGLVSDLSNYLPSPDGWSFLRKYETRQWLELRSVIQPRSWSEAATSDALEPGTTALTVEGVRHRAGRWEGRVVRTRHDVSFTAFVVCRPSYSTCHLLRLSLLDKPLP